MSFSSTTIVQWPAHHGAVELRQDPPLYQSDRAAPVHVAADSSGLLPLQRHQNHSTVTSWLSFLRGAEYGLWSDKLRTSIAIGIIIS